MRVVSRASFLASASVVVHSTASQTFYQALSLSGSSDELIETAGINQIRSLWRCLTPVVLRDVEPARAWPTAAASLCDVVLVDPPRASQSQGLRANLGTYSQVNRGTKSSSVLETRD